MLSVFTHLNGVLRALARRCFDLTSYNKFASAAVAYRMTRVDVLGEVTKLTGSGDSCHCRRQVWDIYSNVDETAYSDTSLPIASAVERLLIGGREYSS